MTDDAFCDTAVRIGRALLEQDAAALLRLSRSDTIECAKVAREYFPGCADADVLTGYGLSSADFVVDVLPRSAYVPRLDAVIAGIDPAFTDELGDGSATVIGVGTCGPDIPRRRTYHLAWTAAIDEGDGAERNLASFEVGSMARTGRSSGTWTRWKPGRKSTPIPWRCRSARRAFTRGASDSTRDAGIPGPPRYGCDPASQDSSARRDIRADAARRRCHVRGCNRDRC